jgi:hypothetical protein
MRTSDVFQYYKLHENRRRRCTSWVLPPHACMIWSVNKVDSTANTCAHALKYDPRFHAGEREGWGAGAAVRRRRQPCRSTQHGGAAAPGAGPASSVAAVRSHDCSLSQAPADCQVQPYTCMSAPSG